MAEMKQKVEIKSKNLFPGALPYAKKSSMLSPSCFTGGAYKKYLSGFFCLKGFINSILISEGSIIFHGSL
jgi:hypothetical protein